MIMRYETVLVQTTASIDFPRIGPCLRYLVFAFLHCLHQVSVLHVCNLPWAGNIKKRALYTSMDVPYVDLVRDMSLKPYLMQGYCIALHGLAYRLSRCTSYPQTF